MSALVAGWYAERPDVVLSLTDPPILGLTALAWARRWRVPFVFLCQDVFPEVAAVLEDFRSKNVERVLARINRLLLTRAQAVVAIGETMAAHLVKRGANPRRTAVIHNWADRSRFGQRVKRTPFAEQHGLADRFVVMHSGNIGLSQGLDHVLDASRMLRDVSDLVFVFQGEGVKRDALGRKVTEMGLRNVRFLPYAPKEQLGDAFGVADVQIVSLRRGLAGFIVPSKLYGILASGRPYVAAVESDSEVATLTARYDSGLIVPPQDPPSLAEAIRRLYADPILRARLGQNGRNASLFHDRPVAVEAYAKLLFDVASNGREGL
jgi:glycosyltransferase involved in cell wall biosynthesis